jgi:hypothetical protein
MSNYFSHSTTGGGGGGGAVTIADGANVVEGALADAAIITDTTGTINGKLRGLVKIFADIWDSVNHLFRVSIAAALPAGTNVIGHVITDTGSTTAVTGTVTVSGTVTANIGTSGSLALDASVTALQVAQASTTSGQKGNLVQGAVTTSAPSYTTAQTDPLSLNTSGGLRVDLAQVAGAAAAANAGISGAGTQRVVQATANVLNITQVTVPATAGGISLIAANANRIKLRVTNTGTTPVYIFTTSSPTTVNGDYLAGIAGYPWISRYEGQLWAIVGAGTQVVTVYEESSA